MRASRHGNRNWTIRKNLLSWAVRHREILAISVWSRKSQPFLPINRVDTRAGPIEVAPFELCNEIIIEARQNFLDDAGLKSGHVLSALLNTGWAFGFDEWLRWRRLLTAQDRHIPKVALHHEFIHQVCKLTSYRASLDLDLQIVHID